MEYSLRLLPLGGFVAFPDDDPESQYPGEHGWRGCAMPPAANFFSAVQAARAAINISLRAVHQSAAADEPTLLRT